MEGYIIAKRYARALFDVVTPDDWQTVVTELSAVQVFLTEEDSVAQIFTSPVIPDATKESILDAVVKAHTFLQPVERFLYILLKKDRLVLLHYIIDAFNDIVHQAKNMMRAKITCAHPLSEEDQQRMVEKLSAMTGRTLECDVSVDETLLCGIIAQVGNTIYDYSLQNKLKKLKTDLLSKK